MLSAAEAHERLVVADLGLPGLPGLLEPAVLAEQLGGPTTRSYLRYKPGTSAVALLDVAGRPAIAHAWGNAARDKRGKSLRHVTPDEVLLDAHEVGLLVVDARTDRRLPALRRLVRTGDLADWLSGAGHPVAADACPQTLAHKPARRWVGRLPRAEGVGHVVLRAYAHREYDDALAAHARVRTDRVRSLRLPRVLATHRRGLIALEHLPGRTLDTDVSVAAVRRLGACLGELHATGRGDVGLEGPTAVPGIDALAPALAAHVDLAHHVAEVARGSLRAGPVALLHGDLSLDQVVADGHDLGLIDLDRVRLGNPLDDVASLLAAAALTRLMTAGAEGAAGLVARLREPLLVGHAGTWSGPATDDLGPRTALALLSRAAEPFRSGHPRWPDLTAELIALAAEQAGLQVAA